MVDSTQLTEIDINSIVTDLNNKLDRDGSNSVCSVCVEKWGDGSRGGRLYSDGYYEEWKMSTTTETVEFKYSFLDNKYIVLSAQCSWGSGTLSEHHSHTFTDKTAGSIKFNQGTGTPAVTWEVRGYIR